MSTYKKLLVYSLVAALAGSAYAEIKVAGDILVSTTWTADNTYNLQGQVYVANGATLTIQPGTLIQSDLGGSLAITRGSRIYANGTPTAPIVFTSKTDNLTSWQFLTNQWGNLTILGRGYISACPAGNGAVTNVNGFLATNVATMEGLTAAFPGDTRVLYGGGVDDDDSGSLSYCSFRYGGKVAGLFNQINGLSLGGVGRNTEISFIEVMNSVRDGIGIWGGTVNLKNFIAWNVGDDSLDIDQGWRGRAQFGLLVQGACANAPQGSGVGDNCMEIDGAERCDWVPVTRTRLSNITAIGQPLPLGGDHGLALRDNAGVQLTSSILMDLGDDSLRDDVSGGGLCDCGWPPTGNFFTNFLTNASTFTAPFYTAQCSSEKVSQITKSIGFRNLQDSNLWTMADALVAGNGNIISAALQPIRSITRAVPLIHGGLQIVQVAGLDPRAANDAIGVNGTVCPNDGFFTQTSYVGAFNSTQNWALCWSAADIFGFLDSIPATVTKRLGVPANPDALKVSAGTPTIGTTWSLVVDHTGFVPIAALDGLLVTLGGTNSPTGFGTLLCDTVTPGSLIFSLTSTPGAPFNLAIPKLPNLAGLSTFCAQAYSVDFITFTPKLTNALDFVIGS